MIKSVTINNLKGLTKTLTLFNPEKTGFAISNIEGLGPVKANVNISSFASLDGGKFNSAIIGTRNIVFHLYFLDKPTIEVVRMETYQLFPLKGEIEITIETDSRTVKTNGIVESNEPDIFSPEESATISVICPDSYFRSIEPVEIQFFGSDPKFKFPFENLLAGSPHLLMSELIDRDRREIRYDGDGEAGITVTINCHGAVGDFLLYNLDTQEAFRIESNLVKTYTGAALKDMDIIEICTVPGQKAIRLYRDGNTINLINCVVRGSDWLFLRKGINAFSYFESLREYNLDITIRYDVLYVGV